MIQGVCVKSLKAHCDERGRLMEILRSDDELFEKFGQIYMTTAYPGVVKAWHFHHRQTDHFAVVYGMAKIVLFDPRDGSSTRGVVNEFFAGDFQPLLIKIPPLVYHGYKCISEGETIVLNMPTELFNYDQPDEHRIAPDDPGIPYDWARHDG
ncbi:MAG: dTDP-4-dehydrorhamnose 3,5-epimerase family protein [Phycisphaerales bacterium]|nr:dTDP-4-dehydrorhamnose 3,5-epimerase family protein [Phycisphaerales bacterium]